MVLDGDPSPTQFTAKEKKMPSSCWKGDWVEPTVSLDNLEKRNICCPCWPSILKPLHYTASMFKPFPQVYMVLCLVLLAKFSHSTSLHGSLPHLICSIYNTAIPSDTLPSIPKAMNCDPHINKIPGVTVRAIPWSLVRSPLRQKNSQA